MSAVYKQAARSQLRARCMGLSFRAVVKHFAPKRHARYTPMPADRSMSFLCFERTTALQDPPLTLRREAHSASVAAGRGFASLRPSISSASRFFRVVISAVQV